MKFKTFFKKAKILTGLALVLSSTFTSAGTVLAKDSDHSGAAYLETSLNPAEHRITSNVNFAPTGNAWFGQDTKKSPEYIAEKISWSPESWKFTESLLNNGGNVQSALSSVSWLPTVSSGNYFSPNNTADKFKDLTEKYEDIGDRSRNTLVMTFPGWAASDRVHTISNDGDGIDRNSDDTSDEFSRIDSKNASAAAGKVNDNLVAELNRALEDNYGALVANNKRNPDLSTEGFMNLLFVTVSGKFPKNGGKWKYNEVDYSIDTSESVGSKYLIAKNAWDKKSASEKLVQVYPNREGAVKSDAYTYAVPKGYHAGVGKGGKKEATDVYAITWFDVATAATTATVRGEKKEDSDSNDTVVGEQVDNWFYKSLSALMSVLGVRNADELVFGEWGNLFKNNTYTLFVAVQVPFIVFAVMILMLAIVDAFRKSAQRYLSVGDVRTIQSVFGRAFNALIMIALLDTIVLVAIFINNALVQFAAQISHFLKAMTVADSNTGSFFTNLLSASGITSVIVSFVLVGINIKFTWRYIARAVSFAIYFVTAPVIFALDAMKGDGGLFSFGPGTGEVIKNVLGLIFQQAMDALGIAFAINIGRMIFGSGALVTILGFLSIEAVVNALMATFGVRSATIRGIAEKGAQLGKLPVNAAKAAAASLAGAAAVKGMAAVKSGRNKDDEAILRQQLLGAAKDSRGKSGGGSKGSITDGLDQEVQLSALKAREGEPTDATVGGLAKVSSPSGFVADGGGATGTSTGQPATLSGFNSEDSPVNLSGGWGAFVEGATNRGIYGDKNTVDSSTGLLKNVRSGAMDSGLNPNNYTIGPDGKVKGKNIDGRLQRLGRDVARGIGGATLGTLTDPKFAGRALLGAAAAGLSTMTPGYFDDVLAATMNVQNYENALTGGNTQGTMQRFSNSFLGRMAGIKGANWAMDSVTAQDVAPQTMSGFRVADHYGRGLEGNDYNEFSGAVADAGDATITARTQFGDNVSDKLDSKAYQNAYELNMLGENPGAGSNWSRDDLVKMVGDGVTTQYASDLLDYMDSKGYESVSFQNGQVNFDQTYSRSASDQIVNTQDPRMQNVRQQLDNGASQFIDEQTGLMFKKTLNTGEIVALTPDNPMGGQGYRNIKQREMDVREIRQNRNLNKDQQLDLARQVYARNPRTYHNTNPKPQPETVSGEGPNLTRKDLNVTD